MNDIRDYSELVNVYNEESKIVINKIREELNEDSLFGRLEEQYNVYDILMFNEFTLKERIERNAFHYKDFRLKYLQELAKMEQVNDRLGKVISEKYQALKEGAVTLSKTEIEKYYLPKDEDILKLKALLRKQEIRAKYFEIISKSFETQGWNMKLWIEQNARGF